jgi:energy-coupling factor transport system ATP-binding protein
MNKHTAAICLERLRYWYDPGRIVLNDIDLSIMENEFIAIIGQNGSGKTTLLKNISGLLRPCGGHIFLRGLDTAPMSIAQIAGNIGFVMQDPDRQLFESSVYNEVSFALKHSAKKIHAVQKRTLYTQEIRQKTEDALAAVGLLDKQDAYPPSLGRSDRVKTVFAAVLAMGSKIIMLDEPIAGQDRHGCRMLMDILSNLHQQGYTIIMVTHNINAAAEYAKRILVMKAGSIFLDGKPEDVFGRTDELAEAGILPPQITRLSQSLCGSIPLKKVALTPIELAEMLVKGLPQK